MYAPTMQAEADKIESLHKRMLNKISTHELSIMK